MKRGFTIIEMVIYSAILAIAMIAVVQIALVASSSANEMKTERRIFTDGEGVLQLITREIRQASDIISGSSTFKTSPGVLALRTPSTPGGSTVITRTFSVSSSRLVKNDGGADEFLTPPETTITNLTFWNATNTNSTLITFQFTMQSGDAKNLKTHTFYGSSVLRAKY